MLWGGKNAYIRGEKKKINFEKKSWWQKKHRLSSKNACDTIRVSCFEQFSVACLTSLSFPARLSAQRYLSPNKDGIDNLIFLPCPKHTLGRSTLTKDWRWEEFLKKNTGRILRNSEKWWLLYRYLRRYCWKNFIYLLQVLGELSDHESLMFLYSSLLRSFLLPKAPLDFFFSMSELLQVQKS